MNILVTGGAGFIGTNLIKRLIDYGHTVYSIDNYSTGLHDNEIEGAVYYNNNLDHLQYYDERFMNGIDVVYHLAAIARIQPSFDRPEEYIHTNFNGTYEVVKYCIKNNIPLIYAGSSSKHSGRYKNPYTFSKDLGEDIIKLYQEHYGLQATITRFYNVYGPYHLKQGGYCTLLGTWERCIESGEQPYIYGDGTKRRDFTHVDDIIDALIMIMEQHAWGYDFELGRGRNYAINDIASMYGLMDTIIYKDDKLGEAQNTLCIDMLAREILNWHPTRNIEDYIQSYVENKFSNVITR
jgi:UDP-glucose 4-epimerase